MTDSMWDAFAEDGRGLLMPLCRAFFRTGKLRLAGQTYQVAVVDGDCDGLFRSILSLPLLTTHGGLVPRCDVFAIDLNRNGTFEISSVATEVRGLPLGSW